ncbi:hypothetical protein [Novosphingobium sp. Rr 2-17]|uniref:hypothetical protein n=1 Tax=Novosphingobium sp. Rr 2-17 TaxID=555793 RepID=UPI0012F6CF37|nr:hypothetical protein [Novosphingobium sp. Rr 2-17]
MYDSSVSKPVSSRYAHFALRAGRLSDYNLQPFVAAAISIPVIELGSRQTGLHEAVPRKSTLKSIAVPKMAGRKLFAALAKSPAALGDHLDPVQRGSTP